MAHLLDGLGRQGEVKSIVGSTSRREEGESKRQRQFIQARDLVPLSLGHIVNNGEGKAASARGARHDGLPRLRLAPCNERLHDQRSRGISNPFHEITCALPRAALVICVKQDERPRRPRGKRIECAFVRIEVLDRNLARLHLEAYEFLQLVDVLLKQTVAACLMGKLLSKAVTHFGRSGKNVFQSRHLALRKTFARPSMREIGEHFFDLDEHTLMPLRAMLRSRPQHTHFSICIVRTTDRRLGILLNVSQACDFSLASILQPVTLVNGALDPHPRHPDSITRLDAAFSQPLHAILEAWWLPQPRRKHDGGGANTTNRSIPAPQQRRNHRFAVERQSHPNRRASNRSQARLIRMRLDPMVNNARIKRQNNPDRKCQAVTSIVKTVPVLQTVDRLIERTPTKIRAGKPLGHGNRVELHWMTEFRIPCECRAKDLFQSYAPT